MVQVPRLVASLALCVVARGAQAQAVALPAAPAPVEWSSMSRAKVTKPLDASGPMASDLVSRAAPAKWSDVPLPPPPGAKAKAAASQDGIAPLAAGGAAATGMGAASLVAQDSSAASGSQGGPGEPRVKTAVDQTGAMVSVTQDLESDRIRQDWAARGGSIPGFEVNGGMTLMYKDLSQQAGAGSYMSGVGFNFGGRIVMLNLEPPKYETRDRSWTAWKIGGGIDMGALNTQIYTPPVYFRGVQVAGGTTTASMTTMTLVGTIGFMHAFGSFDSPTDWSGFAIGADWAPSYQSTSMKDSQSGQVTTNSSFNAAGFAINFESGSMKSMAAKMGKKAHLKLSLFFLPPTGDIPFLMTASLGAVWY